MRKRFLTGALTLFVLSLTANYASAATIYTAVLLGSTEFPPVATPATGLATLTLNGDSLAVDISFSGLLAPATASHIHCCVPPGTNTGVSLPFVGFPGTTGTGGTDYTHTFDLTLVSTYTAAFIAAEGGTAAGAEAALIAGFNSGMAYVNIHDDPNPGGEIRGFVTAVVPEPATLWLGAAALLGIAAICKRK